MTAARDDELRPRSGSHGAEAAPPVEPPPRPEPPAPELPSPSEATAVLEFDLQLPAIAGGAAATTGAMRLDAPVTALAGPPGSGRSRLLAALAGLVRPLAGRIVLGGRVLFDADAKIDVPTRRRHVGVVFGDARLFPQLDVAGNLRFGERGGPLGRRRRPARGPDLEEVVDALGLEPVLGSRPDDLGPEQARLVALGRALLARPELLLVDAPAPSCGPWPPATEHRFSLVLDWAQRRLRIPVVRVCGSLGAVVELTDRLVALDGGRVVAAGEVFDVLGRTLHGAFADAFGLESVLRVEVDEAREDGAFTTAFVAGQELLLPFRALSPGFRSRIAVRACDISLARGRVRGLSAPNQLAGRIVRVSDLRGHALVHVGLDGVNTLRAEVTPGALDELGLGVGDRVCCIVEAGACEWLPERAAS